MRTGGPGGELAPPLAAARRLSLEIQVHPADIRRRVRYLFLGRGEVLAGALAGAVYLLFLLVAVAVAPAVIRFYLSGAEYQSLATERARQGERLQELVGRLDQLSERGEDLDLKLRKVRLAYGLSPRVEPAMADRADAMDPMDPVGPVGPGVAAGSIYAGALQRGERLRRRLEQEVRHGEAAAGAVAEFERGHPEEVAGTPSACPLRGVRFVLTTPFARIRSPFTRELTFHAGIDLAAPIGTPIHAPADGVVTFAGTYPVGPGSSLWQLGKLVVVTHSERFATAFGHCDEIAVRPGQRVRRGDVLGTVGESGWSTHPHLHYEVHRRGADGELRPVDPRLYVLDQSWPNEERLLAQAGVRLAAGQFDPLPAARGHR